MKHFQQDVISIRDDIYLDRNSTDKSHFITGRCNTGFDGIRLMGIEVRCFAVRRDNSLGCEVDDMCKTAEHQDEVAQQQSNRDART